jgi:DUF971 family protein
MADAPQNIRVLSEDRTLELTWTPDRVVKLPFHFVRCQCPCAACVDEHTGVRLLKPATIPEDIAPTGMGFSGNYALKIGWSDGHHTGLFTWDFLDELSNQQEAL